MLSQRHLCCDVFFALPETKPQAQAHANPNHAADICRLGQVSGTAVTCIHRRNRHDDACVHNMNPPSRVTCVMSMDCPKYDMPALSINAIIVVLFQSG